MLKVAIVGCGKIADSHAAQIQRIQGCEIVGVCDREPLMAKQLYERFPVKRYFSDLTQLLEEARPDVVHVTTSPESHFSIAKLCLEAGCNVYVEKPFTLYEADARSLIDLAVARNLKITAGHDDQFSHVAQRMRALVQEGFLGGTPVHMESYYCYELGNSPYASALLGDKSHWVRRLPGKLLQNIISHGIARIAEYLSTDSPQVMAHGFTSPLLRGLGETEIIDELRVMISELMELQPISLFLRKCGRASSVPHLWPEKRSISGSGPGDADPSAWKKAAQLRGSVYYSCNNQRAVHWKRATNQRHFCGRTST